MGILSYDIQAVHFESCKFSDFQIPGLPPMPPMPSMPLPPGMGVLQAMGMMGGPPPPGIRMSMEPPPGVSSGMAQDDPQKMAQRTGQVRTRVLLGCV